MRAGVYSRNSGTASSTAATSTGQSSNSAYFNSSIPAPVAHDVATTRTTRSSAGSNAGTALEEVDLVQDDELRSRLEPGSVGGELAVDRAEPLLEIRLGGVEHVDEQSRALEMREELVAETRAVGRALDEPGDVGDGELPLVRPVDDAEDRLERRERVVGDLRLRVRDAAEERRLAGVREAGERRVDHELETKLELELVAREAGLREARRLTGGRREARVTPPSLPSPRDDDPSVGNGEVGDEPALAVEKLRPDGHAELRCLAVGSVLLAPAPVAAACRPCTCLMRRNVERSRRLGSTVTTTSPPRPPSPPSGPPFGTYFSRRKLRPPSPPRPASTWMCARS